MRFLLPLVSLLAASSVSAQADTGKYDVCVIGAGAYGMASAVFARDRGYSVLVLDQASEVGGHCDTYKQTVPIPQGLDEWMEMGVLELADTKYCNLLLDGNANSQRWHVDTRQFFERFVGPNGLKGIDFSQDPWHTSHYIADSQTGYTSPPSYLNQNIPTWDWIQAYIRLNILVTITYPQLDAGFWEGPVPPELLVPFSQFIINNQLEPLYDYFRSIVFIGGLGQFHEFPAFYALRLLSPTDLRIFDTPNAGFTIKGGCQGAYNNMVSYLGTSNVKLNATVTNIQRPAANSPANNPFPINIHGTFSNVGKNHRHPSPQPNQINSSPFSYQCGHLVLGLPQIPSNHQAIGLDLDAQEQALWGNMKARGYYDGLVQFNSGTLANSPTFTLSHKAFLNPPSYTPAYPSGWAILSRPQPIPNGPAQFFGYAPEPLTSEQLQGIAQTQINQLPASFANATILEIGLHVFQAHPSVADLSRSDGWYTAVRNSQGRRNTIWGGASVNFPTHHVLINDALVTIEKVLPKKN